MLEERINDKQFIRLIKKWLRAGILEENGKVIHPTTGTPQGGVCPVLANIYLDYVLDIWFKREVMKKAISDLCIYRYAGDYVCAFRYKQDAEMFYHEMQSRLKKFNLELSMEKTNIVLFSRYKKNQSGSFEFLGFEFRWGKSYKGGDTIIRRTSRKKLKKSIKNFTQWCKTMGNKRHKTIFKKLNSKLREYYNYYGLINNGDSLKNFSIYR